MPISSTEKSSISLIPKQYPFLNTLKGKLSTSSYTVPTKVCVVLAQEMYDKLSPAKQKKLMDKAKNMSKGISGSRGNVLVDDEDKSRFEKFIEETKYFGKKYESKVFKTSIRRAFGEKTKVGTIKLPKISKSNA